MIGQWEKTFRAKLEALSPGLADHPAGVVDMDPDYGGGVVRIMLEYACKAQSESPHRGAREFLSKVPRKWLAGVIEPTVSVTLDLEEEWEYRRLLELYEDLGLGQALHRLVQRGLYCSQSPEVIETAREWNDASEGSGLRPLSDGECLALRKLIGARCASARNELGLSQRGLARVTNQSPSWVREIEKGSQYAPWRLVVALAEATGHPIGWFCSLVNGDNERKHGHGQGERDVRVEEPAG